MNICFTPSASQCKKDTLNNVVGFHEVFDATPETVDVLVVSDADDVDAFIKCNIDTCVCFGDCVYKTSRLEAVKSIVSCGMNFYDSVTFSSIGEDTSLICIRRPLAILDRIIEPCEFKFPFDRGRSIYQNLVVGLISHIVKEIK